MSKDFVVGRIVKMSDVPFHKGSAGYDFIAAQRRKEAEAILAAEHRVAEAALRATAVNIQKRTVLLTFGDMADASACILSIDDLRRLKGEG